jgi:hypothetical protein
MQTFAFYPNVGYNLFGYSQAIQVYLMIILSIVAVMIYVMLTGQMNIAYSGLTQK